MTSDQYNRKKFLAILGAITAQSILPNSVKSEISSFPTGSSMNDYFLAEGLAYLNTGTLGPCRRDTIIETQRRWEELESLPVRFYGKSGAESLAEHTRGIAATFLGCNINEMMVTNSTTNGMNAIAQGLRLKAGDRILTTDQEHGGGLLCWNYFAKYYGVIIDKIAIPPGENNAELVLKRLRSSIRKKTKLISVSHVLSSTGLRMPIAEISLLARANGIISVVDGAQAAGAIEVNVKALGCDAYATSGHKWLMGPKGTGLLYLSEAVQDRIRPMQFEESHNTYNNTSGVVNLADILGLGTAIGYLQTIGIGKVEEHNLLLRQHLFTKLTGFRNATILSPADLPLISPMLTLLLPDRFEKIAFVKMLLDKYKISIRPTHKEFGFNGIRFSMHIFNTEKEIDYATEALRIELA